MKTLRCEWCGQRESNEYPIWGHKESAEASYFISHKTRGYCVMAALARAEAAEGDNLALSKELIELQERFDAMESIAQHDQQQLIEMAALVAELEAALAAQQWRPVTEAPPAPGRYMTGRGI